MDDFSEFLLDDLTKELYKGGLDILEMSSRKFGEEARILFKKLMESELSGRPSGVALNLAFMIFFHFLDMAERDSGDAYAKQISRKLGAVLLRNVDGS